MTKQELPVRVAIFRQASDAIRVVATLHAEGFSSEEIGVICRDDQRDLFERQAEMQHESGAHAAQAAASGAAIGGLLGGLTAAVGIVATGGVALAAAGAVLASAGSAAAGGLIGAMTTRGFEPEIADYYDQSVREGRILVSVESDDAARLARAERLFEQAGAEPVSLREG